MSHREYALTRRRLVAGTAGTLALGAMAGPGRVMAQDATPAASPAATPVVEVPDMVGAAYEFQVGSFNCMSVSDGASAGATVAGFLFGGMPEDEAQAVMQEAGIDPTQLVSQKTSTVIDTGSEIILVDTGSGPSGLPDAGLLIDNLRLQGIQPNDVDVVVFTHGHPDHVGGALTVTGNPLFANARYVMSQEEWDFWTDEARVEETIPDANFRQAVLDSFRTNIVPLEGTIELIGYGEEIVPGVMSVAAQGHTPGHMGLHVESDGEQLWVLGDAALNAIQVQYPELIGVADTIPEQTIETRRRLYEQLAGGMAVFNHFHPFPSLGEVVTEGDTWRWQAVEAPTEEEEA